MRTSKDCKIVHSDNNSFRLTLQTLILKYSMCFFAFRMEGQEELVVLEGPFVLVGGTFSSCWGDL